MTCIVKKKLEGKKCFFSSKSNNKKELNGGGGVIVIRTRPAAIGARSNTPGSPDEAAARCEATFCTAYYS